MMDFDGKNVKRLTSGEGTVISPAMSNDQSKIVYSLIKNHSNGRGRNVDLYILNLATSEKTLIASKQGINSGAIFTNDGTKIILTQSYTGSADIYEINLTNKIERKITKHFSADVDPSINETGTLMTFLSDRAGKAMVYTANPNGVESNVNRISFVGQFNATPRFSPDGNQIAFASWVDNTFDIYRINSNGQGLVRLTKDFGSNEDPSFSNDGEFILFSSQRILSRSRAVQNLYIMDSDGEIITAVTEGFGNCISPRWSK
jgi:TolB protein